MIGTKLDNAHGEHIDIGAMVEGYQELVVILERDQNVIYKFNLSSLIALARVGAMQLLQENDR